MKDNELDPNTPLEKQTFNHIVQHFDGRRAALRDFAAIRICYFADAVFSCARSKVSSAARRISCLRPFTKAEIYITQTALSRRF
jgi:hypothetical protein